MAGDEITKRELIAFAEDIAARIDALKLALSGLADGVAIRPPMRPPNEPPPIGFFDCYPPIGPKKRPEEPAS